MSHLTPWPLSFHVQVPHTLHLEASSLAARRPRQHLVPPGTLRPHGHLTSYGEVLLSAKAQEQARNCFSEGKQLCIALLQTLETCAVLPLWVPARGSGQHPHLPQTLQVSKYQEDPQEDLFLQALFSTLCSQNEHGTSSPAFTAEARKADLELRGSP